MNGIPQAIIRNIPLASRGTPISSGRSVTMPPQSFQQSDCALLSIAVLGQYRGNDYEADFQLSEN